MKVLYKKGVYHKYDNGVFRVVFWKRAISLKLEYRDFKTERGAKIFISRNTTYTVESLDHYSQQKITTVCKTLFY